MAIEMRWVGAEEAERVAQARMLCYGHAFKQLETFRERVRMDGRPRNGDFLLAEDQGEPVGTATSLSMTMWVRGSPVPCQGVSWVGTAKTHRRRSSEGQGIATQVMRETLRIARERGHVVSALMPFRASFYEHFGYGLVERRNEWTVPLSVLPHGNAERMRVFDPADLPELMKCRQRAVERGQCDIERHDAGWAWVIKWIEEGFIVIDRPDRSGPARGFIAFHHENADGKDVLHVNEMASDDHAGRLRQLHFLASLKDQYASVVLTLPVDVPLNWLLRETQVPHRPVNHAHAKLRAYTRMQVRVLDHKRFLEAVHLPKDAKGHAVVEVSECDGNPSRFAIDFDEGRARVGRSSASATFTCPDRVWSAIACGDLPATRALQLGLATGEDSAAIILDALNTGPAPFCNEYF